MRRLAGPFLALGVALAAVLPATQVIGAGTATTRAEGDTTVSASEVAVPTTASGRSLSRDASGSSQQVRTVAEVEHRSDEDFSVLGVTWASGSSPDDLEVQVRTHAADGATDTDWGEWTTLEQEDVKDSGEGTRGGTSPAYVGTSDRVQVRLLSAQAAPEDVEVSLIDGGTGLAEEPSDSPARARSAGVPAPDWVGRHHWGVNTSTQSPCSSPTTVDRARGVTIHHTAGNNGYSAAQAPGIVRSIHRYHTASLGWCDIGYNFLVDKYGTIYVGRRGGPENQVRGAHAGNYDVNTYFTGVSVMGNFEHAQPTAALKQSVVHLIAWRLDQFDLNPRGTSSAGGRNYPVIHGHRDVKSTACPGHHIYTWLQNGLRGQVADKMASSANGGGSTPTTPPAEDSPRLSGENRYATAANVSADTFPDGADTVFLTAGNSFPDALAAGPAAGRAGAPVLLAHGKGGLPAPTRTELERLDPDRVYVLGGTTVVSQEAQRQAASIAGTVQRLAGSNRYATATRTSQALWGDGEPDRVYLASGESYADALAGGALAAHHDAPLLLAHQDDIPEPVMAELARLDPDEVFILGGEGALSEQVYFRAGQALPDMEAHPIRLYGQNRYETAAKVAARGWTSADRVYVASGVGFADALAGVPAAAERDVPLLLVRPACAPQPVTDLLGSLGDPTTVLLGGTGSLRVGAAGKTC